MRTGHELFLHGLNDMLDAERQLVEALHEMESNSTNKQLKKAFASHRAETEEHARRLTECFELLGETPQTSESKGIRGIIEEKKAFMEEEPSPDILDVFLTGAAMKAETYEICEYDSLIQMSKQMNHDKVTRLLNANRKEERAALKKLEEVSEKLKVREMMTQEQKEKSVESFSKRSGRAA